MPTAVEVRVLVALPVEVKVPVDVKVLVDVEVLVAVPSLLVLVVLSALLFAGTSSVSVFPWQEKHANPIPAIINVSAKDLIKSSLLIFL